jgi:diguanylate cyclase (GGDEF)-like protein
MSLMLPSTKSQATDRPAGPSWRWRLPWISARDVAIAPEPRGAAVTARAPSTAAVDAEYRGLFESLFSATTEGVLVCGSGGLIRACNTPAADLLGALPHALVGQPLHKHLTQATGKGGPPCDGEATVLGGEPGRRTILRVTSLDPNAGGGWLVLLRDDREAVATTQKLEQLANFDSLTGLANRSLFRDSLDAAMQRTRRGQRTMALLFLDLDRFKLINDDLGHAIGDRVLKHVAATLKSCLRGTDSVLRAGNESFTLSRLGGDEFTVIAEDIGSAENAAHIAQRVLDALAEPLQLDNEELVISASIGIALYPIDDVDIDGLIRHADMAMYRSKAAGRNAYSFFSEELNAANGARISLESSLRRAIERHEFELHYQPKADLKTGRIVGVEALLRWNRPEHGIVAPNRFIGVLEETGMIMPVGAWVIRTSIAQMAEWDRCGLPPLRVSFNLSARQFRHQYIASLIEDSLREHAIDPRRYEIELTESLLMEDTEVNRVLLDNFRRMGVGLAIDDFGTGHSSLAYLKRFAIDTLKIDRSFVQSLPECSEDMAIATAIVALGRSMQMRIVAEGVETDAQAQALRGLGCDEIQGYLLSRPLTAQGFAQWLEERQRTTRESDRSFGAVRDTGPITVFAVPADL